MNVSLFLIVEKVSMGVMKSDLDILDPHQEMDLLLGLREVTKIMMVETILTIRPSI